MHAGQLVYAALTNDPGGMLMNVGTLPRRHRRARWIGVLAAVAAVALAAGACQTSESSTSDTSQTPGTFTANDVNEDAGPPQSGGLLAFGLATETDGWSPQSSRWGGSGYIVGFSIFDPLAAYGEDLEVQPYLASSFDHNEDFTEWTIGVRPGVTFHDGTPVNAEAIAANLRANKASPLTGTVFEFANDFIPSEDGTKVTVPMNKSWSTFPEALTAQTGVVAAPSMATDPEAAANPVGSGPFIFESWEQNNELKVRKNPEYWRSGLPYLDNIEFRVVSDNLARSSSFESGSIDIFETADAGQILDYTQRAEQDDTIQMFTNPQAEGSKIFIALNMAKPPFDDLIAREAVAYGIDTAALSEQAFEGIFPPVDGVFSKNSPYYAPDSGAPQLDQEKARQRAQEYEAKYAKPLTFTTNVLPTPESQLIGQVIQAQLRDVGIVVSVQSKEAAAIIGDTVLGNYESTGFILFGSPSLDREYVFFAGPAKPIGALSLNFTRIPDDQNQTVRDAMDTARATDDPVAKKEQYAIVQEEMAKNLNMLFLVQMTSALVFTEDVNGALRWNLPDASGGEGPAGQPTTSPFTANIWMNQGR